MEHNIPIGSIVEVNCTNCDIPTTEHGLRLYVVRHDRDCDRTPLYSLSFYDFTDTSLTL
jgi:hypothetical protein